MNDYIAFINRYLHVLSPSTQAMWYEHILPNLQNGYGHQRMMGMVKMIEEALYNEGYSRRAIMNPHGRVEIEYHRSEEERPIKKVKTPKVIKEYINLTSSLGEANHPIKDKLLQKAGNSLRKYEELVFNHFQDLCEEFPEYENFHYEYVQKDGRAYYNLKAKERE